MPVEIRLEAAMNQESSLIRLGLKTPRAAAIAGCRGAR